MKALMQKLRAYGALGVLIGSAMLAAQPADAATRSFSFTADLIGDIRVLAPEGEPQTFVFLISDTDGVTPQRLADAEELVKRGAAVALVDLAGFIAKQAASDDVDCHYAFGDLEDAARAIERQLGMTQWRQPIMLGYGDGGTVAYLAIAQAPANTAAGAVSIGFKPYLKSKLPFCPGAPEKSKDKDGYTYSPMPEVPGRWSLIASSPPPPDAQAFTTASPGSKAVIVADSDAARFNAAAEEIFDIASAPPGELGDLPLIELPAKGRAAALFVLLSGDGGWRDIDKQIGEYLSQHGVSVVGVDSLRYFWTAKEPKQVAADIGRIVHHYTKHWDIRSAGIGGYSLGAGAIPLAWPFIKPELQDKIGTIVLLGLEPTADLQVTVSGWLGLASNTEIDVRPHLSALPRGKVMCFFGAEETADSDTACTSPEIDAADRFERPGGHHFDGDYQAVARMIADRLQRQAAN
jgi:type IV secretory pathway VirJ component